MKTNAARLLDRLGIAYELREYEVDPADLAAERIAVSAGVRGLQIVLSPADYARAAGARLAAVARPKA